MSNLYKSKFGLLVLLYYPLLGIAFIMWALYITSLRGFGVSLSEAFLYSIAALFFPSCYAYFSWRDSLVGRKILVSLLIFVSALFLFNLARQEYLSLKDYEKLYSAENLPREIERQKITPVGIRQIEISKDEQQQSVTTKVAYGSLSILSIAIFWLPFIGKFSDQIIRAFVIFILPIILTLAAFYIPGAN